jgi:hypothetical protein
MDAGATVDAGGKKLDWHSYTYSWRFGSERADVHQQDVYGMGPVSPNFLVFDGVRHGGSVVHYLTTRIFSPHDQAMYLDFGGLEKTFTRQAWINGTSVVDVHDKPLSALPKAALRCGWNRIVLRIVQTGTKPLATFAVLQSRPTLPEQPRFMPLSRWNSIAPDLVYDYHTQDHETVGWYRFAAPPGAKEAKLNLVAKKIEAWIDGEPTPVSDDVIRFPKTASDATQLSQVALRVHQKTGDYEGAAFQAPIAFKCGRGKIELGDWSKSGLTYYSGGVSYIRNVHLDELQKHDRVMLDLGELRTSAELKVNGRPLGVRLAPPFTFDITDAVHPGDNEIQVEVLNTLANYMSAGPTKFVYPGQTLSGLLGPVSLRLLPQVRIRCRPAPEVTNKVVGETG